MPERGKETLQPHDLDNLASSRTVVVMRAGQSAQTLAHELGHAMGDMIGPIQLGEHVDDHTHFNSMHGNPIIGSLHTTLKREQIAALKEESL